MNHFATFTHIAHKFQDTIEHPKLWIILSAIGAFICQYVFSQWAFAIGFFIIFIMDTISGAYVAWRLNEFSGKIFRQKLMDKSLAYFTIIISFSVGTKIVLEGSETNLIQYLNVPFYSLFIAVELRSVAINWYKYTHWQWLKDLLDFLDAKRKKYHPQDKDEEL
jgi:phage-related holin